MRHKIKRLTITQAQVVSDARIAAQAIPPGLDDFALADAVYAAWVAWMQRTKSAPPNGIYLFNITVIREYLTAQGQQMTLGGLT